MDNPLLTAISMVRSGRDPSDFLGKLATQNPQIYQYFQITNGKSSQQLRSIAENMARERGISIQELANSLDIR